MSKMQIDKTNIFPRIKGGSRKGYYKSTAATNLRFRRALAAAQKTHRFKRTYNVGTSTTNAVTNTLVAANFSLNDLPGYTEFTALYDYYKITGVKFALIPYQTQSNSVSSLNNAANVPIFYAVDTSDSTAPTTVEEICEYQDHKIARLYDGFSHYFKPKFTDATSASRDGWISTSNPTLNWFGIKFAIPPTANAMTYYQVWTIYIQCKDPK